MDYKEKYEQALERAKKIIEFYKQPAYAEVYAYAKEDIPSIFPELAESEDERIKKAITHILYENYTDSAVIEGVEIAKIVAWLEKQGGQKPTLSEEDEVMLMSIISDFAAAHKSTIGQDKWLKSLKNRVQPHWKPTEEQVEALGNAIEFLKDNDYSVHELIILFNDLQFMRVQKL